MSLNLVNPYLPDTREFKAASAIISHANAGRPILIKAGGEAMGWIPLNTGIDGDHTINIDLYDYRIGDYKEDHATLSTGAKRSSAYGKGAKFDPRYDLMMRNSSGMRRLAETWGEGFQKYGADNCFNGFPESVLMQHALDHILKYLKEGNSTEDNLGHAAWNILMLIWVEENKPELLDLKKLEQKP